MADGTLNINVGILGHVDSGKTSLVRALSTQLSTAALDKHPQSQERGITLDLGFSAFNVPTPPHVAAAGFKQLQFTLVDCPGHASLIRTIIGGSAIMDAMVLVIDSVKGIQTQTAECLVLAEIMTDHLVVVLNKTDLLGATDADRAAKVAGVSAKIRKVLASTKFANAPMLPLSAAPGGGGKMGAAAPVTGANEAGEKPQGANVAALAHLLAESCPVPKRDPRGPFLFAVDHCFPIKGQGTVLTGTVLSGSVGVGDSVEAPSLSLERRVKSMQMFRKPVQRVSQGDRAGLCVTNLDASLVERALLCAPGTVPTLHGALALVKRVRFHKGPAHSGGRFHVSVGHETVMATAVFYGARELALQALAATASAAGAAAVGADADLEAAAIVDAFSEMAVVEPAVNATASAGAGPSKAASAAQSSRGTASASLRATSGVPLVRYDWAAEFEWQPELLGGRIGGKTGDSGPEAKAASAPPPAASDSASPLVAEWQWAALLFDKPVCAPPSSLVIGSRLDTDLHAPGCRLVFHGRLCEPLPSSDISVLARAKLYKRKLKRGVVDRVDAPEEGGLSSGGGVSLIGRSLFSKETDMNQFTGLIIHTRSGQAGTITGSFGKSGKFKATFSKPHVVNPRIAAELAEGEAASASAAGDGPGKKGKGGGAAALVPAPGAVADSDGALVAASPPAIRPGDALFLRYRKYMYQGSSSGGEGTAAAGGKGAKGGAGAGQHAHRIVQ